MARFWSSAVGLALWTKTSISQSESLKNGQFRRIFVISPLFFSTFYKNAAQPLGFVWFWFKQHTCTPTQWYATRSAMTTPLQPVDVNTPAIKRKVARAVSNDRLHLAVETVYPFSVPRETGPKATFTDKKKIPLLGGVQSTFVQIFMTKLDNMQYFCSCKPTRTAKMAV